VKDHVMLFYFNKKKRKERKEKKNLIWSECESSVNVRFQHVCKFAKTLNDKEEFRK